MIVTTTTYGIAVTDGFGSPNRGMGALLDAIKDSVPDLYRDTVWMQTFPSADDQQVVVGILAPVTKRTDFAAVHQQWNAAVAQAPEAVKALIQGLDPDVHFLAGHA